MQIPPGRVLRDNSDSMYSLFRDNGVCVFVRLTSVAALFYFSKEQDIKMVKKFYSSTLTHRCPKCNTVLKEEKNDDFMNYICALFFIPVGLIVLIAKLIKKKSKIEEFNKYGEQIICCPHCQSIVAITSNGGLMGSSRIIVQEKELLEMMKPIISYLQSNYGFSCSKYNNKDKYSEMLVLCFKNDLDEKCVVIVMNNVDNLKMKIGHEEIEPFDIEKLVLKIIDTLN